MFEKAFSIAAVAVAAVALLFAGIATSKKDGKDYTPPAPTCKYDFANAVSVATGGMGVAKVCGPITQVGSEWESIVTIQPLTGAPAFRAKFFLTPSVWGIKNATLIK